jgi:iron(III) transport system permease protein
MVKAGLRLRLDRDDWLMRFMLLGLIAWLSITLILPLSLLLVKSFQNAAGEFIGLTNYVTYFSTPSLFESLGNSLFVATSTTLIVTPLAYAYAYALRRTCMPAPGFFYSVALLPILAPSLLPAISLIYLFGNQGFLKEWLFGHSIYGPIGIIISQVFYCLPHALVILMAALAIADARHYEAARVLRTNAARTFLTITLPGSKYGLISAAFVVFTLSITDFGIAKVIGGRYNVLATDIFKQVIGQQNFEMGAVVGFVLLMPALVAFGVDRWVQGQQVAYLSAKVVPFTPTPHRFRDNVFAGLCMVTSLLILAILGMSVWASFVTRWPYNLSLTVSNYVFSNFDSDGWRSYWNSLELAFLTAFFGTILIFVGAYLTEKTRGFGFARGTAQFMAMLPMAVPGLVLGLSYIFFFNAKDNPLGFVYATMAILVMNSITHFYTVSHITATTALKQMDREFEAVSASLKVSLTRTFTKVTTPICLPAVLDISMYLFVNAMTTVSAVIFLYSSQTRVASVSIIHMDEAGFTASAAAMSVVIVATSAAVKTLHWLVVRRLDRKAQAWRQRRR